MAGRIGPPDQRIVIQFRHILLCLLVALLQACNRAQVSRPRSLNQTGADFKALSSTLEISGSERYKEQVHRAIVLLQTRDLPAYKIVTDNVGRIQEGQPSGMQAYATPPVYVMSDLTAFSSLTWCAATIAHDSFHSKLYHDYQRTHSGPVPNSVWIGRAAEQECMKHQISVMRRIGASGSEISYAKAQADGHYVTKAESWREYRNRKW